MGVKTMSGNVRCGARLRPELELRENYGLDR